MEKEITKMHQYRDIEDSEFEDLRAAAGDAENLKVGPFDDYDVSMVVNAIGDEVALYASRCEICGGFDLVSPFGGDYSAYLGPGTFKECLN